MKCAHCRSPIEWDAKRNVALEPGTDVWTLHRCIAVPVGIVNECICNGLVVVIVGAEGAPRLDWPGLTPHSHKGLPSGASYIQAAEQASRTATKVAPVVKPRPQPVRGALGLPE